MAHALYMQMYAICQSPEAITC
uniref:Uncharacterized protein n=1 Tax=Rhizophora mucronata TaxID=61149 RepID=A0A2P2QFA3_RHIMU